MSNNKSDSFFLDITTELCPLTFVRAKLMIERLAPGQTLEVRLNAGEPLQNVPRSLAELGHEIIDIFSENPDEPLAVHRLVVRRV